MVTYDGKSYVEKSVAVEEKPGIFVTPRASEFKLVLGGFIQMNSRMELSPPSRGALVRPH